MSAVLSKSMRLENDLSFLSCDFFQHVSRDGTFLPRVYMIALILFPGDFLLCTYPIVHFQMVLQGLYLLTYFVSYDERQRLT